MPSTSSAAASIAERHFCMATFLYRLGRWCASHGWRVLAAWVVALGVLGGLAAGFSTPPSTVVEIPDAKFQDVMDHLEDRIPEVTGTVATAVFTTDDGAEFTAEQRRVIADVVAQWSDTPHVTMAMDPFEAEKMAAGATDQLADAREQLDAGKAQLDEGWDQLGEGTWFLTYLEGELERQERIAPDSAETARLRGDVADIRKQVDDGLEQYYDGKRQWQDGADQLDLAERAYAAGKDVRFVSEDGSAALAQIGFDIDPQSLAQSDRDAVIEAADTLKEVGVSTHFGTELMFESSVMGIGEVIGLMVAALVLLAMLGSVVAAGLPLFVAIFGVAVGLAAAVAASWFYDMHQMTPALALMLGLAVGIDYTLFIVNRHRGQMLAGVPVAESVGRAVGTAGNAVVFAGATVVVALSALVVSGIPILGQMGLVAAGAVVSGVVMAITLAPALLGIIGRRVLSKRAWRRAESPQEGMDVDDRPGEEIVEESRGGWYVRLVTAKPWLTVVAIVGLLGVMAWPLSQLQLGLPDGSSEDPGSSAHTAYTTVSDKFGPGMNGPVVVTADLPEGTTKDEALQHQLEITTTMADFDGVAAVMAIGQSADHRTLAFQVVPTTGPTEQETSETVHAMMTSLDNLVEVDGIETGITGRTVANIEISERLSDALGPYLTVVVGLSLVILMLVFRSVVVPVIATGGFLLSVGAAFGALVAVFQWGWLGELFGVHTPGPLMSFGPILLIGVLFGLAMDYQMFLVSGMREAYAHGEDARTSVRLGFTHGAKVVTAAAAIMFAVFGGFVFSHMAMIRPIGFGLAVGVLIDAVVVRMTLTPALMHLLGDKAWWMPKWLDRVLPDVDVEGTKLARELTRQAAEESAAERYLVDA
jgi:RND superfamily putative drug exporter